MLLPLLLLSSGCDTFRKIMPLQIKTVEASRNVPIQNRPRPVDMNGIYFYVVNENNFEEFKGRFTQEKGDFLFYAISVRDYETLALNMSELKRFIKQQKELIVYYEEAVKPKEDKKIPNK